MSATALLRAISDHPDDDTPRLVYADWLDEHGDPARAEFIRTQCQLVNREGGSTDAEDYRLRAIEDKLLEAHQETWTAALGPFNPRKVRFYFHRGFPERVRFVSCKAADFEILRRLPDVRHVCLEGNFRLTPDVIRDIARLRQLDHLRIERWLRRDWLPLLAALPCWTYIDIEAVDLLSADWEAFQDRRIRKVSRLSPEQRRHAAIRFLRGHKYHNEHLRAGRPATEARVDTNQIVDAELRWLSYLPELEELSIHSDRPTTANFQSLSRLRNLKSVWLDHQCVAALVPLTKCTTIEKLEVGGINDPTLSDDGVVGLENLTKLRNLRLPAEGLQDATARRLASLRELRSLHISLTLHDEESLSALSGLTHLESLRLGAQIGDRALRHLSRLTNLTELYFDAERLTDAGLKHFAPLKKLRTLEIPQATRVTRAAAQALADQLPAVTILLGRCVVKSPRTSVTFHRYQTGDFGSALFPTHWDFPTFRDGKHNGSWPVKLREDGWASTGWHDRNDAAKVTFERDSAWEVKSASDELEKLVRQRRGTGSSFRVQERDVVKRRGGDTASCVFRDRHDRQHLACVVLACGALFTFECDAPTARFGEFRDLFLFMARSIRVGKGSAKGVGEETVVPITRLRVG